MDGNAQLLADAPQRIPAWVGKMGQGLGHLPEDIDAAMAKGNSSGNLRGNRLGIAEIGQDGDWQVAVANTGPFPERIVVGAHHVQLEGGITEVKIVPTGRIGKEYLCIHAVAIQRLQPFPRIIGGSGDFFPTIRMGRKRIAHKSGTIAYAFLIGRPIVNSPTMNAASVLFDLHDPRNTVLPFAY